MGVRETGYADPLSIFADIPFPCLDVQSINRFSGNPSSLGLQYLTWMHTGCHALVHD